MFYSLKVYNRNCFLTSSRKKIMANFFSSGATHIPQFCNNSACCLVGSSTFGKFQGQFTICDRTCEKGPCRASFQNRVITTIGKSRL